MKIHYICLENSELPNSKENFECVMMFSGLFFFHICNSDRQQRQGVGNG